jgi:hypothetical protein
MKVKYVITALCFCCSFAAFAQNKLFDKYAETDGVASVYISKTMFQMMPTIENVGLNLMNMQGKIESLQIISTAKPEQIPRMREDFSQLVKSNQSELMRVRDGKTRATFYATMQGEKVNDLLMLAESDSSYTVIQLLGNFTLQDIRDITNEIAK